MTEYTLFADDPTTVDLPNNSDGGAAGVLLSVSCLFGADGGAITAIRFLATTTVSGTYKVGVYDYESQALLYSQDLSGSPTAGAWHREDLDTPLSVDDTHTYVVWVWNSAGRYVAELNLFQSHNEGSLSNVYAWGDHEDISSVRPGITDARQGMSKVDSIPAYPTNITAHGYMVAPVWDDAPPGGGTTYPVTLAATAVSSATALTPHHVVRAAQLATTAVNSATTLAPHHVVRRVSLNATAIVSRTSLRFSAPARIRRGGVLVEAFLAGVVRRDGQSLQFG